jgi:RNA polymerase sigma-70 factor, ECF subfamily
MGNRDILGGAREGSDVILPMAGDEDNITTLLQRIRSGDAAARDRFSRLVYGELKNIARGYMARERPGHTLQPTAIVHEAYIKLFGKTPMDFQDRSQFYKAAALQMRRYLKDYGLARRGPERRRDLAVSTPDQLPASPDASATNLVIHELLDRMEREDPKAAEVVEMKFYTGLTYEEIAGSLGISVITVRRRWATAMTWLVRNMKGGRGDGWGDGPEPLEL